MIKFHLQKSQIGILKRLANQPDDRRYKLLSICSAPFVALILKMVYHQHQTEQTRFILQNRNKIFTENPRSSLCNLYKAQYMNLPIQDLFVIRQNNRLLKNDSKSVCKTMAEQVM